MRGKDFSWPISLELCPNGHTYREGKPCIICGEIVKRFDLAPVITDKEKKQLEALTRARAATRSQREVSVATSHHEIDIADLLEALDALEE